MPPGTALPAHVNDWVEKPGSRDYDNLPPNGIGKTFWATVIRAEKDRDGKVYIQYAFFDLDNDPTKARFFRTLAAFAANNTQPWDINVVRSTPSGLIFGVIVRTNDFEKIMAGGNPLVPLYGGWTMISKVSVGDAKPLPSIPTPSQ